MKKKYIIFCFLLSLYSCVTRKVYFEAFTHPLDLEEIPVYSRPNKFYSYLKSGDEAGWLVQIKKQKSGYFNVKLPSDCNLLKKDVWVKLGEIGVVVQNYDSIKIPMYVSADTLSKPITYICTSTIGEIYDIKQEFVLLRIKSENKDNVGWFQKKYLCGNPYTTCN